MLRPGLALAALAFPAAAQSVLVVDDDGGPGVHTEVASALLEAQDGDVILVREGAYTQGFVVDGLAVTIAADAGATPVFQIEVHSGSPGVRITGLAPGETVVLR